MANTLRISRDLYFKIIYFFSFSRNNKLNANTVDLYIFNGEERDGIK